MYHFERLSTRVPSLKYIVFNSGHYGFVEVIAFYSFSLSPTPISLKKKTCAFLFKGIYFALDNCTALLNAANYAEVERATGLRG